jgi:carbonic anhydrase/acetyltransferase-like protein (isoleucine patch superfamily)
LPIQEILLIRTLFGKTPQIAESAFVAQASEVLGDVEVGEESSIWPGTIIRGDDGPIRIGDRVCVQDNSVLHADDVGLTIGNDVNIGHAVVIAHAIKIGNHCLIANNCTVLEEVEIGDYCIVAAGAVVPPRTKVPDYSFVVGIPAEVRPEITEARRAFLENIGDYYAAKAKLYKAEGI